MFKRDSSTAERRSDNRFDENATTRRGILEAGAVKSRIPTNSIDDDDDDYNANDAGFLRGIVECGK